MSKACSHQNYRKRGRDRYGSQRFLCKDCGASFLEAAAATRDGRYERCQDDAPRPRIYSKLLASGTPSLNKQERYRLKCVQQGRCPCCGKDAEGYYFCFKHRLSSRVRYLLQKLAKEGLLIKLPDGTYRKTELL